MPKSREIAAANLLEELIPAMKEIVISLRNGTEEKPYVAMYWLRRELSYIVASLGVGSPKSAEISAIESKYEREVNRKN